MSSDTKTASSSIDDRIDKLTTIVEQLVAKKEQDKESFDKLMEELSWIQSWTKQTFYIVGLFLSVWAFNCAQQYKNGY